LQSYSTRLCTPGSQPLLDREKFLPTCKRLNFRIHDELKFNRNPPPIPNFLGKSYGSSVSNNGGASRTLKKKKYAIPDGHVFAITEPPWLDGTLPGLVAPYELLKFFKRPTQIGVFASGLESDKKRLHPGSPFNQDAKQNDVMVNVAPGKNPSKLVQPLFDTSMM
jgi:hypothetical protein